jgi:hypothetical protein
MTAPLVLVKRIELWSVPLHVEPSRLVRVTCEPLVLDGSLGTWTATGERNERGQLLYERRTA